VPGTETLFGLFDVLVARLVEANGTEGGKGGAGQ